MKMRFTAIISVVLLLTLNAVAAERTLDISGNNTSSNYVTYNKSFRLLAGNTMNVKMARYCYFSSTIAGAGTLNLYAGGERCYLGTEKGAEWPDWSSFRGDIHIYPFSENAPNAGFYGVVLAHGGKSFSPENIENDLKDGKVNNSMENNHVTLHEGATICCEANTAGAGFRIGELQTEVGSTLRGYMKNSRAAYYLLGCLNTDATLAGKIAPTDYRDDTPLGIIKEGTGTYRITGNDNYLSGSLRILEGRVLVNNNSKEASSQKLRGGLGAKSKEDDAIAYVFSKGVLGGTGSIAGSVDNYGTIEPGDDDIGTLTLKNYVTSSKKTNLTLHPASKLRFKVSTTALYDQLVVNGALKYSNMNEDFSQGDKMPQLQIVIDKKADVKVGDEFTLLTAKSKTGDWNIQLQKPEKYTWEIEERQTSTSYSLVLVLSSLADDDHPDNPDDPDNPDNPEDRMGAFYDDGIDDATDTHPLRYYANMNGKYIGVALSTWKTDITNTSLAETQEAGKQFSMLVPENEMKMDNLQPNRGEFNFWAADNLVDFAKRNKMLMRGHCLVWHQQQPGWVSSDGKKNDKNWSRTEALKIMEEHITQVMKHFKGNVAEWDVVNECLDDDQSVIRTNPETYALRQNVWQRAIGNDYIDSAFVYAHRADPTAALYLNDYDVEFQGTAKSVAFYNLAMRLKRNNIPIDGVGLQCHFSVDKVDSAKLDATIRRFGEAGLKCIISELDMGTPSTSEKDLLEQARLYRVVTDIALNNDNCPHIVIWGLKDNDSWRSSSNPLLYTAGLAKKPAWYAVRSALRHRTLVPATQVVIPTADKPSAADQVYTLDGRLVKTDHLRPGIYIKSGKKIIVKP